MQNQLKILLLLQCLLFYPVFNLSSRIICPEGSFLCGNKCFKSGVLGNGKCLCGSEILVINYEAIENHKYCCINAEDSCLYFGENKEHVFCYNGTIKHGDEPCFGRCSQLAERGILRLSCDDRKQCYLPQVACSGIALCRE